MKAKLLISILLLAIGADAFAKKDFKGLFGSYRREKFTENEARSTDFGIDLNLSTLLPLNPLVKSEQISGTSALAFSTFFNVEGAVHMSLWYNWQVYALFGYYTYETRQQTEKASSSPSDEPTFHHFEMTTIPVIGGLRYRFSNDDIVPYIGMGAGFSRVSRKGYWESTAASFNDNFNALTMHLVAGFEFYFSSRAGIRLETSAYYMQLKNDTWDSLASHADNPVIFPQGNVWSIRYASGLFILL